MSQNQLKNGVYEVLLSEGLAKALDSLPPGLHHELDDLSPEEASRVFAEAAGKQIAILIDELEGGASTNGSEKLLASARLVNDLMAYARERVGASDGTSERFLEPPRRLVSISPNEISMPRPAMGLSLPWLFTAARGSPSLLEELRKEIESADGIDILVSFITVSGVRKIIDLLHARTSIGSGHERPVKIRVLTTTYTGATQQEAVDRLARLPGAEVRVSLDGRRSRLHAKAWIFRRDSGFGCAYAGSANLSGAALLGGLEWTVKFTQCAHGELFDRAEAHFETLWEDTEFQRYDPASPEDHEALRRALLRERSVGQADGNAGNEATEAGFFSLSPKTYQAEMLDSLELERERGRCRNLLVAATGTGKTMVAAFDYHRICQKEGGYPRLLFVANRKEILIQAMRTFREVLRDHSFGELLAEGREPERYEHLFATIQSLSSKDLVASFGSGYWHTVIIDECHRLAADSFDRFARSISPRILLGLTATPERSDGKPIADYFDSRPDGAPAVELRLWTALDLQLLAPFEYFGCDDETDFSEVPWDRGAAEVAALDWLLTGNHARAKLVIDEWIRLTGDPRQSRALAFCVNIAHAKFMTEQFNAAGIRALCVVGSTDPVVRRGAPASLARGEYCVLVTCDLYNEGIDIPSVDTILLLRPTQSPVLFQQQIGRGLRLDTGKESCLVLDFVGRFRKEFRIDLLYRSITGLSARELEESLETGFNRLPQGCHFHLERQPRARVLEGLRSLAGQTWPRLAAELRSFSSIRGRASVGLADFLYSQKLELTDIYRKGGNSGWTTLKRKAGLVAEVPGPNDDYFGRRFASLLHYDDPERTLAAIRVAEEGSAYLVESPRQRLLAQMLAYQIDGDLGRVGSAEEFYARLALCPALRTELGELAHILHDASVITVEPVPGLENTPLALHASYSRREILTALGVHTATSRPSYREGVVPLKELRQELLFVTLDKRQGFHAAIAYHDYAISAEKFHWQSQNSAGPDTMAGKRYLDSPHNGWKFQLFIRNDRGSPYRACGPVTIESWSGDRPLNITWRLGNPLPPALFREFSVLRDS